jgi:hypothetical protein
MGRAARAVFVFAMAGAMGVAMVWAALVAASAYLGVFVSVERALNGLVVMGLLSGGVASLRSWRGRGEPHYPPS